MSRLIAWSEVLVTGIPEIDDHHERLIVMLNELHGTVHRRRGATACREALERLRRHAATHFAVEESLMHANGHTGYRGSEQEQHRFLTEIDEMLERIDDVNSNITFQGLHQLKVLLLRHVRGDDVIDAKRASDEQPREETRVFGLALRRA